ncbi:MAG: DUF485 domain-containing protein [Zoogloeaceae bacterium]|jgi:uncharacterized membrane protein (DUF485 family)|nr:DUF485 domain-containing protein [Zoogloeaceae bacterium]
MSSDVYTRMMAHPRYAALTRARRGHTRRFVGMALLAFAAYLLLVVSAEDWLARPLWEGLSVTWVWLLTLWFAFFIVALVFCSARALQGLDVRLESLMLELLAEAPDASR